jgi:hypothetical protein
VRPQRRCDRESFGPKPSTFQKLAAAAGTAAGFATGGVKGVVLGREAMSALEKLATSTAWGTVSAVIKDRLANALALGDTSGHRRPHQPHGSKRNGTVERWR